MDFTRTFQSHMLSSLTLLEFCEKCYVADHSAWSWMFHLHKVIELGSGRMQLLTSPWPLQGSVMVHSLPSRRPQNQSPMPGVTAEMGAQEFEFKSPAYTTSIQNKCPDLEVIFSHWHWDTEEWVVGILTRRHRRGAGGGVGRLSQVGTTYLHQKLQSPVIQEVHLAVPAFRHLWGQRQQAWC